MPRMLKEEAQRFLADVPEQYVFWSKDGRILRNMTDLEQALIGMTDETFAYHANKEKNDFSNWVKDIIGDTKLARDLSRSLNRAQAAKSVSSRLAFLNSR